MRRFKSCFNINTAFRFSSTSSIIDNKSNNTTSLSPQDVKTLDQKLKGALQMRKKLCGLPNNFTTYFRAVDGINDGVQINNENIIVDILASNAPNKIKDYFILHRNNEREDFRNLVSNAFKEEGYADFWQDHHSLGDDGGEFLFFRELTIFYPFRKHLMLDGSYSLLMRGRLARQVFFFDVLRAAEIEQDESCKNTKNVLCFNTIPHSSSMLAHLANASENVAGVFVVEANPEMIAQGKKIAKLQIEMQKQEQQKENSGDESALQFMDLEKYFQGSSFSSENFDVVSIELQVPEDSSNENVHKKILEQAVKNISSSRSPRKIFILAYTKNGDSSSTSAEKYGLKLIRSCQNFLVANNNSLKQSPSIIRKKDDENNDVIDQEKTIEAFLRHDEIEVTIERIKERAKMGTGGYRLRVVKKIGQGPEFPVNVMAKSSPIEECYRHVCAFVVEVW